MADQASISRVLRRAVATITGLGLLALGMSLSAPDSVAFTSRNQLLTAHAPSMCDNPEGTLVNGELPNIPGWVAVDLTTSAIGELIKGGGKGAAATFHCTAGGIGWADHLVFYDANGAIIGHYDTGELGIGGSSRAGVAAVSIHSRKVVVRVVAVPMSDDNELWGSTGARLTFAYDSAKKQVTKRSTTYFTEKATGKKLLSLIRAGRLKQARKLASASVVAGLKKLVKQDKSSSKVTVKMDSCGGPQMWGSDYEWFIDQFDSGERGCLYSINRTSGSEVYSSTYLVVFGHPSGDRYWTKWYGNKFVGVAG